MASLLEAAKAEKANNFNKISSNITKKGGKVLSKVNAINTILQNFPSLIQSTYNSLGNGSNGCFSFNFFFQLLKIMGVTEEEITNWISSLLADKDGDGLLSVIEETVKSILLLNFQSLFSCSFNPFIPDKLMTDGIEINLANLDLYGLLKKCPTDEQNRTNVYYFDTEGMNPNSVYQSCDFNAFLWYCVNKGSEIEQLWDNRVKYYGKDEGFNDKNFKKEFFKAGHASQMTFKYGSTTYTKKPILFCQYREHSPKNITGTNTIKVRLNPYLYKKSMTIIKKDAFSFIPTIDRTNKKKSENVSNSAWGQIKSKLADDVGNVVDKISEVYNGGIGILNNGLKTNKTIFEFNYDFIYSLKLFESKSLAAIIIKNFLSTTCNVNLNISANVSRDTTVEEETITQMISKCVYNMLNSDEYENVPDDYFAFSNTEYEEMVEKAIEKHNGKFTLNDNEAYLDFNDTGITSAINHIGEAKTLEEQKEALANALTIAQEAVSATFKKATTKTNIDVSVNGGNFTSIFNLLSILVQETVTQIVMQALSPKVYFLYLVNAAVMGDIGDLYEDGQDKDSTERVQKILQNPEEFYRQMKNVVKSIVSQIKEIIIKELYQTVLSYLKNIIKQYVLVITKEAMEYYKALLASLLTALGVPAGIANYNALMAMYQNMKELLKGTATEDTYNGSLSLDNVTYPDIIPTQETPKV